MHRTARTRRPTRAGIATAGTLVTTRGAAARAGIAAAGALSIRRGGAARCSGRTTIKDGTAALHTTRPRSLTCRRRGTAWRRHRTRNWRRRCVHRPGPGLRHDHATHRRCRHLGNSRRGTRDRLTRDRGGRLDAGRRNRCGRLRRICLCCWCRGNRCGRSSRCGSNRRSSSRRPCNHHRRGRRGRSDCRTGRHATHRRTSHNRAGRHLGSDSRGSDDLWRLAWQRNDAPRRWPVS